MLAPEGTAARPNAPSASVTSHFDRGIASAVEDLAGMDVDDRGHETSGKDRGMLEKSGEALIVTAQAPYASGFRCWGSMEGIRGYSADSRSTAAPGDFVPRMFTGLVESLATVTAVVPEPPGIRVVVDAAAIAADAALGDSICVSGCCLSVVQIDGGSLHFQLAQKRWPARRTAD